MADMKQVLQVTGHALARAGVFVGSKVAQAVKAVDPDVYRHAVQVPLLSYSLLVSRHETIEAGKDDGHPPLIFVHGLGGNRGNFLLMAGYFRLMGRRRSYKIHFDPGQSMADMAAALADFITQVLAVTGAPQVEMVAHSLGGIVARMAITDHGLGGDTVKTLVTLGSPHRGTYAARFANTETTRLLRPDSDFMKTLADTPLPAGVRTVCLFSHNDLLVIPGPMACLPGSREVDVTPFTHYSYLLDPKSWSVVWQELGGASGS